MFLTSDNGLISAIFLRNLCVQKTKPVRSLRNLCVTIDQCDYDEEDAKPSVSKTSSSKSADHSSGKTYSEVEKKNRTASGSRSHSSQRHSRTSQRYGVL